MTRKWLSVAAVAATLTSLLATNPVFAQTKPMATPTPAMGMKKMPLRDAKGHFMKASPSPKPMMGMKKMPMRDAKGRFMKSASPSPKPVMGAMGTKKMPMRDAKGRFMKASPSPKPMMAKP